MTLTPSQIVAKNLRRARRELRDEHRPDPISQEKAGTMLAPFLGKDWQDRQNDEGAMAAKLTISAWERSEQSDNPRAHKFTVEELVALSLAFDVSPLWFLLPPEDEVDAATTIAPTRESDEIRVIGEYLDLLFHRRLVDVQARLEALPAGDARHMERESIDAYTREALGDLNEVEDWLADLARTAGDLLVRFGGARARVTARIEERRKEES